MKRQWKKKIALCLGGLVAASTGTALGATVTTPILSGAPTFTAGDEVQINGPYQFGIRLANLGDTVTTTGKLDFDFTTTLLATSTIEAISLKNGGLNTLGTGSEITVVTAPAVNYPANAILIGKQSGGATTSIAGSDLKIDISGRGGQIGIHGQGNVDLGSNSQITATSATSSANGINMGSATIQARNLTLNSTGGTSAAGMVLFQSSVAVSGQNNSITSKSGGNSVYGIWVDGGNAPSNITFERVDINVEAASVGATYGVFSYMKDNHINLGSGSTITTKNALGVSLEATQQDPNPVNSTFTADRLTLKTEGAGAHGIQSFYGHTATLTNSSITTNGTNAMGLLMAGGATNNITNSTIKAQGASSYGAYITEIGTPNKAPATLNLTNSTMTSTNHGIYVRSTTMTDKNQGVGAITINAKDSSIKSTAGYGIRALGSETTMNMDHSTLESATGMAAVRFEAKIAGDKLGMNLTNQSTIKGNVESVGVAGITNTLTVSADQSQVLGNLTASAGSTLDAKFANNSYWQGVGSYAAAGDTLNVELGNSNWDMTGNSQLTGLNLISGGNVNFKTDLSGGSYGTLTVENLSGSDGVFNMRTNMAAGGGDILSVTGTTAGSHSLNIQNAGGAVVSPTYEHLVVQTADGQGAFGLTHKVEVGAYQYDIHRDSSNQNNWSLFRTEDLTPAAAAAANEPRAGYYLNYAETQTLIQRMGDLRDNPESAGNVWAKLVFGKNEVDRTSALPGFDQNYGGIQVGVDKKSDWKSGDFYKGVFAGYTNGSQDYETGSGDIDSRYLGVYGTYIADSGFYVDGVLKFGWLDQSFRVRDTAGAVVKSDSSTNGAMASLEVGQRIHFDKKEKQGFYLEPQAQISWGHQSGDDFTASNDLSGTFDSYNSLLGRVGLLAGYELKGGKNPINVYAKASYNHEFEGKYGTTMNGAQINGDLGDSWWSYGVGVTAQVSNKHNLYADLERASGGDFTQSWKVNVGYRFQW